jgi:hypothetical protein
LIARGFQQVWLWSPPASAWSKDADPRTTRR